MFKTLFPILLLEEQLSNNTFFEIQEELDQISNNLTFSLNPEDDTGGLQISDEGIQKTNDILERYNLVKLKKEVLRCTDLYLKETNTVPKVEVKTVMSNMTLLPPGKDSTKHMHSPDFLVAVYYYKTPENSGNIRLYNPLPYLEFQKDTVIDIVPTEGKLLVFPGWLFHEVLKNNSDSIRHSVAITMQIYGETNETL
jgi:uncharacterized protein (TIGR02466 family)